MINLTKNTIGKITAFTFIIVSVFLLLIASKNYAYAASMIGGPLYMNSSPSYSSSYVSCPDTVSCATFSTCWNDESVNVTHCGPTACTGGSTWTKYAYDSCVALAIDPTGGCYPAYVSQTSSPVYSTADKCYLSDGPYLRAGYCDGSVGGIYKVCCNNSGGGAYSGACVQVSNDYVNPPYEGICPAGSHVVNGTDASVCGSPAPGQPSVSSGSAMCTSGQTSAQVTIGYSGGSGATYHQLRYSANDASLGSSVTMGSSPYTLPGFSPGNRIYYNVYACNSGGCTPDYNGYYYVDLPATCGTNPPTPTPTQVPGYVCSGTCGTGSSPQGQACGSNGTWQWDGQPSGASSTCRTNPNTYCYICQNVSQPPTPTPVGPTPTPISGSFTCSGPTSGTVNTFYTFSSTGGSGTWTWSGGASGTVSGTNPSYITKFNSTGNYTVTVSSNGRNASCPISIGTTGAGWAASSSPTCAGTRSAIVTTYTVPAGQNGQLCYTRTGETGCFETAGSSFTPLTGSGTYTTTSNLTPGSSYNVYLQLVAGAVQQGPQTITAKACSPPTCSGPSVTSPTTGTNVQYTAGGGTGSYSWTFYNPSGAGPFNGGTVNPFTLNSGVTGTYQVQVTSGGLSTTCTSVTYRPAVTCSGVTAVPTPMVAGTSNTLTIGYTGNVTTFNWGSIAGSCTNSSVCNYGASSSICAPTNVNFTATVSDGISAPVSCPAASIQMLPRHSVSGSLYLDYGSNNCASGSTLANISRTVTLNNVSSGATIASDTTSGSNYLVSDSSNFCSANRSLTISNLPAGYTVVGYRRNSSGAFTSLSGFTTPPFTYLTTANIDQVDWCLSPASPWFQTTSGDVRFPSLSNSLPSSSFKPSTGSDPTGSNPSVFISSTTNPAFGAGLAPIYQVGREYNYNNDFQQGLGSASYTFYKSQARKKGITPTPIGGSVDPSTLATGIYQTSAPNVTVSSCNPIPANRHVILLADHAATLTIPPASCALNALKAAVKIPSSPSTGGLFVLAAKGDITIDRSVGTANTSEDTATQLDGYYTSEGNIILDTKQSCATGVADNRLNVGGALVANSLRPFASTPTGGKIVNNRSLCAANVSAPTYKVYSRLDFVTQLTDFYKNTYKTFKEVSP